MRLDIKFVDMGSITIWADKARERVMANEKSKMEIELSPDQNNMQALRDNPNITLSDNEKFAGIDIGKNVDEIIYK